jgi:hypothetical protein
LRAVGIPGDKFFDGIATERATAHARKYAGTVRGQIPSQPAVQDGRRVAAERRAPLLPAFSVAPDVRTGPHHDVLAPKPNQFRHTQTGLDVDSQQGVITTANPRRPIRRSQHRRDLRFIEEGNRSALMALAGHCEDLLAQQRMRRFRHGDISKKRVNGGQARVPGPTAVAALLLQMLEESPDERGLEIVRLHGRRSLAELVGRKSEEQSKRIAIPGDRMGAGLPLSQ